MIPAPRQITFGRRRFYPAPIERAARLCAGRCTSKLSLKEVPIPVPVEQWIEGPLAIRFGVEDLSRLGQDVLGAAFIRDKEMLVSEKLLSNEGRFRFTCAHELGHFELHGALAVAFRDTSAEPGGAGNALHEREADRFAAAFLMPAEHVARTLTDFCAGRRLDPMDLRSDMLSSSDDATGRLRSDLASLLADRFGVSLTTAMFRLREVLMPEIGPFMSATRTPWLLK